jgi:serine/threonine protein kinase
MHSFNFLLGIQILLSKCNVYRYVEVNPEKRATAKALMRHPWMSQVVNIRPSPMRVKNPLLDFALDHEA